MPELASATEYSVETLPCRRLTAESRPRDKPATSRLTFGGFSLFYDMDCPLATVITAFADGLLALDGCGIGHKNFRLGVGPYGEADAVKHALQHMRENNPAQFGDAQAKRLPDILIPGKWALEAKIIRPFGDNGRLAEHWSENILHPYAGNTSSLGDCLKLVASRLPERKGIIVFGYEHSRALVPLDPAICSFELLAAEIINVRLSNRIERRIDGLCHPVHQVLRVFGWELLDAAYAD